MHIFAKIFFILIKMKLNSKLIDESKIISEIKNIFVDTLEIFKEYLENINEVKEFIDLETVKKSKFTTIKNSWNYLEIIINNCIKKIEKKLNKCLGIRFRVNITFYYNSINYNYVFDDTLVGCNKNHMKKYNEYVSHLSSLTN